NRTLSVPGATLEGVFQLRTVEDCDRIRAATPRARRAVVMGLGFIGSEVSASLRQLGIEVAAVEGARVQLARVLGDEVGQALAAIHREKGVELVLEDSVAALEGSDRVERVRTRKGRVLPCDMVVAGIGIVPNTELLAAAGAEVDNGVIVDEHCRTSLPDVFAAGDVTNHLHPIFGRLRVEHWNNGYQHGRAAARSLLGGGEPYDYVHSFWSDQYEHAVEYVGFAAHWDRLVFRGRPESRKFLGFYLKHEIPEGAIGAARHHHVVAGQGIGGLEVEPEHGDGQPLHQIVPTLHAVPAAPVLGRGPAALGRELVANDRRVRSPCELRESARW